MERIIIIIIALIILMLLLFVYFYINIKQNKLESQMAKLEEEHIFNEIESSQNDILDNQLNFKQNISNIYETDDYEKNKSTLDKDLENTKNNNKIEEINISLPNEYNEIEVKDIKEDKKKEKKEIVDNYDIDFENNDKNQILEEDTIEILSFEPIKRKIEKEINKKISIQDNKIEQETKDEYELVNIQVNKKNYIFQTNEKLNKKDKIKLLLLGKVQFGTVTKSNYYKKKDLVKTKPQKLKLIERK